MTEQSSVAVLIESPARTLLIEARALIADEAHFTAADFAVDEEGKSAWVAASGAARYSAIGALARASSKHSGATVYAEAVEALRDAARTLHGDVPNLRSVGLRHGHAGVLACYDAAIAALEQEV